MDNRRTFLKGIGAALALPPLESVVAGAPAARGLATTATGAPLRSAYIYIPNGVNVNKWMPQGEGADYQMGDSMKPLERHRKNFQVLTGFAHENGTAGGDGAGDHARASATFLTGARPKKTAGADIHLGISADQVAANQIGDETRLASLELSCDATRQSGGCDSGYSCAYQFNMAWRSATTPVAPESNPRLVFERLFGSGSPEQRAQNVARRQAQQKSLLDFLVADANTLNKKLGRNDQQKLDEYLTGVREIEKRIEKSDRFPLPSAGDAKIPDGIPSSYEEHMHLLFDLLTLAFESDSTRIASFMLAHDGSNRSFKEIGVSDGHHNISHHKRRETNLNKIAKIDKFYCENLGYFLDKLNSKKDVDGNTLLHNSMIVYGSGLSDADRHSHRDLPVILAGNGGGTLQPGVHKRIGDDVPLTNLYMSMFERTGVKADRMGDSTGVAKI